MTRLFILSGGRSDFSLIFLTIPFQVEHEYLIKERRLIKERDENLKSLLVKFDIISMEANYEKHMERVKMLKGTSDSWKDDVILGFIEELKKLDEDTEIVLFSKDVKFIDKTETKYFPTISAWDSKIKSSRDVREIFRERNEIEMKRKKLRNQKWNNNNN